MGGPPDKIQPIQQGFTPLVEPSQLNDFTYTLRSISEGLINTRYQLDPWGEGLLSGNLDAAALAAEARKFDSDPLFRTDAFDCMTFVIYVIAAANAQNSEELMQHIISLNYYSNNITYATRRHFVETDFIPALVANGYGYELTRQLVPNASASHTKIDKPGWFKYKREECVKKGLGERCNDIKCPTQEVPCYQAEAELHYIPFYHFYNPEFLKRLPDVSLIILVHSQGRADRWQDRFGWGLLVRHMSFLIRTSDGNYVVRHASAVKGAQRVIDEPLTEYIIRNEGHLEEGIPAFGGLAVYGLRPVKP